MSFVYMFLPDYIEQYGLDHLQYFHQLPWKQLLNLQVVSLLLDRS
jgi:hypothetical protein